MISVARVKRLQETPYTQKEAEAAVGLQTDNTDPLKVKHEAGNEIEMMI